MLEASGRTGLPWARAVKGLEDQSSVPVDQAEFNEVIRTLEHEGAIKVVGAGERRTIKKISD
jgi:DNA replication licensing factor MCM4